jgi:hypothetical protein
MTGDRVQDVAAFLGWGGVGPAPDVGLAGAPGTRGSRRTFLTASVFAAALCAGLTCLILFVPSGEGALRSWGVAGKLVLFCQHLL